MAIQPPYGNGPGDIEQAKKKLQGRMPSLAQPVAGNPVRAASMQQQFEQPVTGPNGVVKQAPSLDMQPGPLDRVVDGAKAAYQVAQPLLRPAVTAIDMLTATPADYLRNAAIRAAGGDPATSEGGETSNRDRAFGQVKPALDMITSAGQAVRDGVSGSILSATGAQPAAATPALKPLAPGKPATAPTSSAKPSPDKVAEQPTGNGYTQTGIAGVVGRAGANGVPEFTNNQSAASGASALPEGGIGGKPLKKPGVSNMADDVPLARRGSINNIGNGIGGGLSVGEDGDAQMAIGRFERANQIRAEMNASRPREIGDNGGRATVVRDSSRAPSIAEMVNERRGRADASADLDQRQVVNDERRTDADIARNNQQATNDQLTQQKTRQEIEAGRLALDGDVRMSSLRAQLADPAITGEQRATLERAYRSLNTPGDKRFITVAGGTNDFGGKDASKVFDTLEQGYVDAGGDVQEAQPGAIRPGQVKGGYVFLGGDPSDKNNWRAK